MVVGTMIAMIGAYLFQLIIGRALGPNDFAPITVLWTIQFLIATTVFIPIEQLTIRRLAVPRPDRAPWGLYTAVILVSAGAAVVFSAATLDRLFQGNAAYLPIVGVLVTVYGGFTLGRGFLAGRRRFHEYGLSTFAESTLRLVLAVVLLLAGASTVGLAWTLVSGALVVWIWRPLAGERSEERARGARREARAGSTLAAFVTANASSQTIVAAGPLVVGFLGAPSKDVSIFFETFLLFRAPLTVAYNLVSRVLQPFARLVAEGQERVLRVWTVRLAVAGSLVAGVAYVVGRSIGPDLVALLLGDEFRPDAGLAGYAAGGVVLATVALFSQQALIAMRATGRLAVVWVGALAAAAIAIALTDGGESLRVARGFVIGEAFAFAGLTVTVLATRAAPIEANQETAEA
ncbi:MAG TPA: hypothetical protein VLD62_12765 [Acidimicrobiia bacterium]|nr:hypothetical protein [Acidimicrobiia bacterium]